MSSSASSVPSPSAPVREEVLRAEAGWLDFPWHEIWAYRELVWLMVRREFQAKYKQSILGPLWFLFQPVATTVLFTVVFGRFGHLPTDGMPQSLFYMGGLVLWNYFIAVIGTTSNVLASNHNLFSKVYFPRLLVPISTAVSQTLQLLLNFVVFLCLYLFYSGWGHWIGSGWRGLLLMPVLVLYSGLFALGGGLLLSALTAKYRDVQYLISFVTQSLLYATPILFPFSSVPHAWKVVVALNPMTWAVEAFKASWFGLPMPPVWVAALGLVGVVVALFGGLLAFNRIEKSFVDTV